jgi:uncharacterized phage protein gp47/JayE
MDYGVTPTGFVPKPLTDIKAEMEADLKANISKGVNLETVSPTGQIVGTIAGQIAKVWEMGEGVYHAGQIDSSGYSLKAVAALTGTLADAGEPSTVAVLLNLDAGATVAADSRIQVEDRPDAVFRILADVTNSGISTDDIPAEAYSDEYGPIVANAGTLNVILDAAAGWNAVTNPEDATLGKLEDSDAELRIRREQELALGGDTTVGAIRAAISPLDGVTSVQVIENDTDATVDTVPPHSIEVIVLGGTVAEIAAAILAEKPAGTGTSGNTTEIVPNEQGNLKTIKFTAPTVIDVWVQVTITGGSYLTYVGDDNVKAALIAYQDGKPPGTDVIAGRLAAVVYGLGGVADAPEAVVTVTVGVAPSPVGSSVSINPRQWADLDTSRINVS